MWLFLRLVSGCSSQAGIDDKHVRFLRVRPRFLHAQGVLDGLAGIAPTRILQVSQEITWLLGYRLGASHLVAIQGSGRSCRGDTIDLCTSLEARHRILPAVPL